MNILQQLKTDTEDLHRGIETVVPLMDPHLTIAEYAGYLERIFPFYEAAEARLFCTPGLREAVSDLDERWKKNILAADLRALGVLPHGLMNESLVPQLKTVPEALGCLYVLEGSTLGGQILLRAVRNALGPDVEGKTQFLASYGPEVPQKWRDLCVSLNASLADPADRESAVRSARATFSGLHKWLMESRNRIGVGELIA